MDEVRREATADQIAMVVHGFVQMWTKFEAMLHQKLANSQDSLKIGSGSDDSLERTNYDLFYRVSSSMYYRGNMTMSELSNALSVPFSTATRMVNWLVAGGYVQRLSDPDDRRVVRVQLTDKGRRLHETIESYTREHVQKVLSQLSPDELTGLLAMINKVLLELVKVAK